MKNLSLFCEKKSVFPDGNINRKQQTFWSFLKYSSIFVSYSILKNDKKTAGNLTNSQAVSDLTAANR